MRTHWFMGGFAACYAVAWFCASATLYASQKSTLAEAAWVGARWPVMAGIVMAPNKWLRRE